MYLILQPAANWCSVSLVPRYDAIITDKNQFSIRFYIEVERQEM